MLTLFTCPKPFRNHIGVIQTNALRSWLELGSEVEVLLIGDVTGMADIASAIGIRRIAGVETNDEGTPLVSSVFRLARANARHGILCYLNSDVLLLDDFLPTVRRVRERLERFLIVGQRWDLGIRQALPFEPSWQESLRLQIQEGGRRHPPVGSDYFVFPRGLFAEIPSFALGRAGWDNWMIFAGRREKIPVVDASAAITVVHQDHDYSHLPGGQPHYRLPESARNLSLAGGREAVFKLSDADWVLGTSGLRRRGVSEVGFKRWLETQVTIRLGPGKLAQLARMILNPGETMRYIFGSANAKKQGPFAGPES